MRYYKDSKIMNLLIPNTQIQSEIHHSEFYNIILEITETGKKLTAKVIEDIFGFSTSISNSIISRMIDLGIINFAGEPVMKLSSDKFHNDQLVDLRLRLSFDPQLLLQDLFYSIDDEYYELEPEYLQTLQDMKNNKFIFPKYIKKLGNTAYVVGEMPCRYVVEYVNYETKLSVEVDNREIKINFEKNKILIEEISKDIDRNSTNLSFDGLKKLFSANADTIKLTPDKPRIKQIREIQLEFNENNTENVIALQQNLLEHYNPVTDNFQFKIDIINGWYYLIEVEIIPKDKNTTHLFFVHNIMKSYDEWLNQEFAFKNQMEKEWNEHVDDFNLDLKLLFELFWHYDREPAIAKLIAGKLIEGVIF